MRVTGTSIALYGMDEPGGVLVDAWQSYGVNRCAKLVFEKLGEIAVTPEAIAADNLQQPTERPA